MGTERILSMAREGELGRKLAAACFRHFLEKKGGLDDFRKDIEQLSSRPLGPIAQNFLSAAAEAGSVEEIKRRARLFEKGLEESNLRLRERGAEELRKHRRSLIIGSSRTLKEIVEGAGHEQVFVTALLPEGKGIELARRIDRATVIPDRSIGFFVPSVDAVVLRGFCVSPEGVLCPAGSRSAASVAKCEGKPVYVAAEFARRGDSPVVTESRWELPVRSRAPLFEMVEASLIHRIITERGAVTLEEYINEARESIMRWLK